MDKTILQNICSNKQPYLLQLNNVNTVRIFCLLLKIFYLITTLTAPSFCLQHPSMLVSSISRSLYFESFLFTLLRYSSLTAVSVSSYQFVVFENVQGRIEVTIKSNNLTSLLAESPMLPIINNYWTRLSKNIVICEVLNNHNILR